MFYLLMSVENICVGCEYWEDVPPIREGIEYVPYTGEELPPPHLGKKYDDGKWIEMPKVEVVEEPTEQEIIQAELLLNQMSLMEQMNAIEMANAEILLNTLGGM